MNDCDVNIDYCGIIILLRGLMKKNLCTPEEAKKIAVRIAVRYGVDIIFPL